MPTTEFHESIPTVPRFVFPFFEHISDSSIAMLTDKLVACMNEDKNREIRILFSGPGGNLHAAFACMNIFREITNPITLIAVAEIFSASFLIFTAADLRLVFEDTISMSHEFFKGAIGTASELKSERKYEDILQEQIIKHLMRNTNNSREFVEKNLMVVGKNTYLTAQEMVSIGAADKVLPYKGRKNVKAARK